MVFRARILEACFVVAALHIFSPAANAASPSFSWRFQQRGSGAETFIELRMTGRPQSLFQVTESGPFECQTMAPGGSPTVARALCSLFGSEIEYAASLVGDTLTVSSRYRGGDTSDDAPRNQHPKFSQWKVIKTVSVAGAGTTGQPVGQFRGIREVDFRNFRYSAGGEMGAVVLSKGKWREPPMAGGIGRGSCSLAGVRYADVTGDGAEDAVVSIECDGIGGGGNNWSRTHRVFTLSSGTPVEVQGLNCSAEKDVQLRVEPGQLLCIAKFLRDDDANCCPTGTRTTKFVYDKRTGRFVGR